MRSAHMSLREGDPDSAVNRAYYAMFNVARAALLNSGVPEGDLPRTHRGVIEAFRNHAVQTGRVDAELASTLSRTESLRLKADYTGSEIEFAAAERVVAHAEKFVRTVEREFGLETHTRAVAEEKDASVGRARDGDSASTPSLGASSELPARRLSPEETRQKAREDWLKNYYHKDNSPGQAVPEPDSSREQAQKGVQQPQREKDAGPDYEPE
jgi:uncharacterized protein (UPF0332 family)